MLFILFHRVYSIQLLIHDIPIYIRSIFIIQVVQIATKLNIDTGNPETKDELISIVVSATK